jgi:hypothetical protein
LLGWIIQRLGKQIPGLAVPRIAAHDLGKELTGFRALSRLQCCPSSRY